MTVFKCFYCGHKTASAIGLHKHEKQCAACRLSKFPRLPGNSPLYLLTMGSRGDIV